MAMNTISEDICNKILKAKKGTIYRSQNIVAKTVPIIALLVLAFCWNEGIRLNSTWEFVFVTYAWLQIIVALILILIRSILLFMISEGTSPENRVCGFYPLLGSFRSNLKPISSWDSLAPFFHCIVLVALSSFIYDYSVVTGISLGVLALILWQIIYHHNKTYNNLLQNWGLEEDANLYILYTQSPSSLGLK